MGGDGTEIECQSFRLVMLEMKTGVIVLWHVVIFMIVIEIESSPWDNFKVNDFEFDCFIIPLSNYSAFEL